MAEHAAKSSGKPGLSLNAAEKVRQEMVANTAFGAGLKEELAAHGVGFQLDPLDHNGDGRKGGVAPAPEVTHLVVLKADADRGLVHGEVIGVADADVKALLHDDVARSATEAEVELAQPRVRLWSPPTA